jgi:LmbE family N-acetylglucosaminyl deacetylase
MFRLATDGDARVLVLAPHTDDGELGCGATISRLVEEGGRVSYAAFSLAEESVPPPFPRDVLEREVRAATRKLGISPESLLLFRYRVRHFAAHRQEILEDLVRLNRDLTPDLVLMPALHDLHQDHTTVAIEGIRAFKRTSILCYELPWNNLNFATQCFAAVSENDLARKLQALDCYQSQKHRNYLSDEFVRGLAVTRGVQIGQRYAEAFEVVRWVL